MAIIYSYPQSKPKLTDLILGTVTYDDTTQSPVEGNPTRTFSLADVADLLGKYTLSSEQAGSVAAITLTNSVGEKSVVNLIPTTGISVLSNGSNAITISNTGILDITSSNTTFIDTTVSIASGVADISAELNATGTPSSDTYLRGDNTWATPVLSVGALNSAFIDLTPSTATNGNVVMIASLSATGTPSSSSYLRGDNTWATINTGTVDSIVAGNGISVNDTDPANPIVSNTGVLSNIAGTGISIDSSTGNSTITNSAPDQVVSITGGGSTTVTGTYPNFTVSSTGGGGQVDSVVAGAGISVDDTDPANPIVANTAPDQTVVLTGSGSTTITGTYPSFNIDSTDTTYTAGTGIDITSEIITNTAPDQVVSLTAGSNITVTGTYPSFTIASAGGGGSVDTIVAGTAISVDSTDPANPIVTNTAPDQTVVLTGAGGTSISGTYPNFTITSTDNQGVESVVAGTGITVDATDPANPIVTNAAPDQTVSLTAGSNVTITGTYPSFTIAASGSTGLASVVGGTAITIDNTDPANPIINNAAPDQTVSITGGGATSVTGTYPNFTVSSTDTTYTAGVGISIDGANVIDNTAPDQIVALTGAGGTTISGTYPNFTITSTDNLGVESVVAGTGITVNAADPANPIVTNAAPDQIVSLTGSGGTTITGTYPSFTIASDVTPTVLPSDFVYISVKNETGSTIAKGTGVMAIGTDGNSGHVLIAPMVANGSIGARYFVGILNEELLNGGIGAAVTQGEIDQLDTTAYLDSDILWCSPTTNGGFVVDEPAAPNLKIAAAIVLNSATNGKILVRVQGNEGLHELHDVGINNGTLANGQLLTYDSTAGYWKNADNAAEPRYTVSYISTNTTAVKDYLYVITASLTLTLPASPAIGDKVGMSNMSGTLTVVMGRNGENIAGIAEDLLIDVDNIGIQFVYTGATKGWILI